MTVRSLRMLTCALAVSLLFAGRAAADEILFLNGDRLTGKITSADGGKLVIKTDTAGEVTVDLAKVKTFSTDEPIVIQSGDTTLRSKVTAGPDGTVQVVPLTGGALQTIALKDVEKISLTGAKWTGAIVGNALITTGNSETENFGLSANAVRRSEIDRITLGVAYYYGRQKEKDTDKKDTTIDNWFVFGKYDYFLTKKLYLYGAARVEQDNIADLNLRLTIGGGVGYQWFETPTFNFNTEAGLAWVYEDFKHDGTEDHLAARLAYHVDWTPIKPLKLFHNLEYLPNITDWLGDYNLNTDIGLRATVYQGFFAEAKIELRYDSTPAPGAKKEDVRYLLGVGWQF
jgi:putative salt-induced outer membrane protein YdiY